MRKTERGPPPDLPPFHLRVKVDPILDSNPKPAMASSASKEEWNDTGVEGGAGNDPERRLQEFSAMTVSVNGQYSSGSRSVVTERSHSVMIQRRSPSEVR